MSLASLAKKRNHEELIHNYQTSMELGIEDNEEEDDSLNTTGSFYRSVLCLYATSVFAVGIHFEAESRTLNIIEKFILSDDAPTLLENMKLRYQPDVLVCNGRVKTIIQSLKESNNNNNASTEEENVTIDVKPSKEFSCSEGEQFLFSLQQELSKESQSSFQDKATLINELMQSEDRNLYSSVSCAFSTYFDRILLQFNYRTKVELIRNIRLSPLHEIMALDSDASFALGIMPVDDKKNNSNKKSLYELLNKTCTKSGKQTLKKFLCRPLAKIDLIEERLDTVEAIWKELQESGTKNIIGSIRDSLKVLCDIIQVGYKLRLGNSKAVTWKRLRYFIINSIKISEMIRGSNYLINSALFRKYCEEIDLDTFLSIRRKLESVLDFNNEQKNIAILEGVDPNLDSYKKTYDEMEVILEEVSKNVSEELNCEVSTAYIPQFGYLIALSLELVDLVNGWNEVFRTSTTVYFKNDIMEDMDEKFGDIYSLIKDSEIEILHTLQDHLLEDIPKVEALYGTLGEIDVMIVFAMVSHEYDFKRPQIVQAPIIELYDSFDPLESTTNHIPNDIVLTDKIMILTGPNYSGKSTLLTKVGLIIFLSHVGCFIPGSGRIGLTNRLLTRMNSRESVEKLQSTFMSDSMQMAKCLNRSTPNALLLLDEFGKGTDIIDGPSLLSASIRYLSSKGPNCPRVIVATHMIETFKEKIIDFPYPVQFNRMKVLFGNDNDTEELTYLYTLEEGIADGSFGIICAKSAGVNDQVVSRAKLLRNQLLSEEKSENILDIIGLQRNSDETVVKRAEYIVKEFLSWDLEEVSSVPSIAKANLLKLLNSNI